MINRLAILLLFGLTLLLAADEEKKETDPKKQEATESLPMIREKVTVTATMSPKAVRECAASVSIVEADDLQARFAGNALNVLASLPGLVVQRTSDFGRADVEIRGLGQRGQRIVIMTDGRPEKMGLFGCAVTHAFPLDNVERIEVVRGPASVLYGSDALGGVINVLTRRPEKGFHTDLQASYGAWATQIYTLRHQAAFERWAYSVSLDRRSSNGHIADSAYRGTAGTGRVSVRLGRDWELAVQGKYFRGKKNEPDLLTLQGPGSWNDYARGAVDLNLSRRWGDHDLQVMLFRDFGEHRFSDGWHSRDHVNGGLLRFSTLLSKRHALTAGADFRSLGGTLLSAPAGTWRRSDWAVFLHDEWRLHPRWLFSAGFRLNRDGLYGWEPVPQAGLVIFPSGRLTLRASVAKGFRSPQLNELFMFPSSNPDLQPERVWNYEAGADLALGRRTMIKATLFRMIGDNLIELAPNPGKPPFRYRNIGSFRFVGVETGIDHRFSERFSTWLSYSWLDTNGLTRGRPGQKWDAGVQISVKKWNWHLHLQQVRDYYAADFSRLRLPSYTLLDSRLTVVLHRAVDLVVDLNNLLDQTYQIFVDLPGTAAGAYPMPGRNLQVGLRIRL